MLKINDFFIGFNQQWSVYSTGDIVTGHATFDFGNKIFADQVVAQFYGSAHVSWTERELKPPNDFQLVTYSKEKVYFDEKLLLWGQENPSSNGKSLADVLAQSSSGLRLKKVQVDDNQRPSLQKGQHKMAFEFRIPESGIPTSYDAKHSAGRIRYYVKVSIMEWGQIKHSRKGCFTIVRPLDLNNIPRELGTATKSAEREISKTNVLCIGSALGGSVLALLTLQKCGYVPGEQLCISVEVDNQSYRSVKYVQTRLVQHTTCYADMPQYKKKASSFVTASTGMQQSKIGRQQRCTFEPTLYVPAVVPTFTIESCLEVGYTVKVEVAFGRKDPTPIFSVEIPVVVGTVPVRNNQQARQRQSSRASSTSARSAPPPPYESEALLPDIPPPTYEENFTGNSDEHATNTLRL